MEKEDSCRKTANTEYVATKCRITKPPPPKPATNPLQFVRVGPCPLYKKAEEQIKKASDVKVIRKEVREEAEDWQHNLDSWKTNRRKMQEHIIERVEEVKKLEQEGQERTRKKSAFSEKRGRRFNIPVYDDDSNDLSDYGIGLSSSKSDKSSDNASQSSKDDINECQILQYGSNDMHVETKPNDNDIKTDQFNNHINNLKAENNSNDYTSNENNIGPYTYEGAIQNYRMRIKTKINVNEVIFNNRQPDPPKNKEYNEAQSLLRNGNIFKRKEIFEAERNSVENTESSAQRKFSEDFANSQSIKERLQSLEKCTEGSLKNDNRNSLPVGTVTSKLQKFNSVTENYSSKDNKNHFSESPVKSSSSYSLDGMSSGGEEPKHKWGEKYEYNQYYSSGDSIFMDKINMFNRDLDTLYPKASSDNCNDEILNSYPPSTSSTELMLLSSDKEDSGIQTADVSCSVSQSDEVLEDPDIPSNTIPKCIEKLNIEKITKENQLIDLEENVQLVEENVEHKRNILLEENGHSNMNVLLNENVHQNKNVLLEGNINPNRNVLLEENVHHNSNVLLEENVHQNRNVLLEENVHPNIVEENVNQNRNLLLEENMHQNSNGLLEQNINPNRNGFSDEDILHGMLENGNLPLNAKTPLLRETSVHQQRNDLVEDKSNAHLLEDTEIDEILRKKEASTTFSKQALHNQPAFNDSGDKIMKPEIVSSKEKIISNQDLLSNMSESEMQENQLIPLVEDFKNLDLTLQNPPIDLQPFEIDCLEEDNVLLSPVLPKMQPPAVKPPPPPVSDSEPVVNNADNDKKFNTTKRLKKEILIKRSTFLGLNEPTDDQIFPNVPIDKPPDVNNFLQKLNGARDEASKEVVRNKSLPVSESSPEFASKAPKVQQNIEEDEITKKEREIIEMIEKEEKCKDHEPIPSKEDFPNTLTNYSEQYPYNYNNPYYLDSHYDNLDDRDSEVLKVEHELLQLEKEERERQKENMLFREKSMKMKQNYHSYENLCDVNVFPENADYYKSMPELQQFPKDYNKPSVLNHKPMYENTSFYRKSMPDIEHVYNNVLEADYNQKVLMGYNKVQQPVMTANHRKASMPELQKVPQVVSNLPIIPAKPLKRPTKEEKEMFKCLHYEKQMKPIARHSLQPSSASRPKHYDNYRQPKINAEPKNYNQHWLIQEAEFRRISEMKNSMPNRMHSNSYGNVNMPIKPVRPEPPIPKENVQLPPLSHPPQSGYSLMPYSSSTGIDESQNVILSVSGKKKCSYCGNELGRGAAMIIETLNLFYHMECFKCCVCHVELGDGLMGTDVRVRNQKLHCHNCYSSDDGVKFSCV